MHFCQNFLQIIKITLEVFMKILKIVAIIVIWIMNFYISSLITNYGFDKIAIYDFSSFGEKANTLVYGALLMIIMSIHHH